MSKIEDSNDLVVSYLALRRLIGILGIGLPIAILLYFRFSHAQDLEASISAYYHTTFRDIFVGVLCAVGVFMIAYKGYENIDTVLSTIAGISLSAWRCSPRTISLFMGRTIRRPPKW